MGLKDKIKQELHYMKLGAKVLPKISGQKVKGFVTAKWAEFKENAREQAQIESEARKAEKQAYREETIKQAILTGQAKARRKAASQGGMLDELAEIGKRMGGEDNIGFSSKQEMNASEFVFSGLPKKRKEEEA